MHPACYRAHIASSLRTQASLTALCLEGAGDDQAKRNEHTKEAEASVLRLFRDAAAHGIFDLDPDFKKEPAKATGHDLLWSMGKPRDDVVEHIKSAAEIISNSSPVPEFFETYSGHLRHKKAEMKGTHSWEVLLEPGFCYLTRDEYVSFLRKARWALHEAAALLCGYIAPTDSNGGNSILLEQMRSIMPWENLPFGEISLDGKWDRAVKDVYEALLDHSRAGDLKCTELEPESEWEVAPEYRHFDNARVAAPREIIRIALDIAISLPKPLIQAMAAMPRYLELSRLAGGSTLKKSVSLPEWDSIPAKSDGASSETQNEPLTDLEGRILKTLGKQAMPAKLLATRLQQTQSTTQKAINRLKDKGKIKNKRGLGYYLSETLPAAQEPQDPEVESTS